ncbi:MAG: ribbon-helix-helix domain-containing protein [Gemmatimonadota bacterium]
MSDERVTVTLPPGMVEGIDQWEKNRSRFIREAVERELQRRRREALRASLADPHSKGHEMVSEGLAEWIGQSSDDDLDLLDPESGVDVEWIPGRGWRRTGP